MSTTETRGATAGWRLSPRARKWVLLVHIVSAVGWLGLNIGNLTLALTGLFTDRPSTQHSAFQATYLLGGTLLIPISLTAFASGLVLSLCTRWGLFKYRWVIVKFGLTLIAVVLIPLSLLPGLRELSALMDATPPDQLADVGRDAANVVVAGCVSTSMYVTNAILSVLKPWGRTRA